MKSKQTVDLETYLRGKGSPLADHLPSLIQSANRYRIDPRLLVAISGGETSFGTNGSGPAVHNAWGIGPGRSYGSWQEGIDAAAKLLRENYIGKGLTSLPAIQRKWAPIGAGNDPRNLNSNWLRTNGGFYSELGGNPNNVTLGWRPLTSSEAVAQMTPVPGSTRQTRQTSKQVQPDWSNIRAAAQKNLSLIASGRSISPLEQLASLTEASVLDKQAFDAARAAAVVPSGRPGAKPPPAAPPGGRAGISKAGLLVTSKGWKETPHAGGRTSGLGWGNDVPADIMGAPGTPIGAPAAGVITRIGSAQEGGASYTIRGDDGYEYWLGHIDVDLPVGARIQPDQVIARVSGEHPRPHLHITRRRI